MSSTWPLRMAPHNEALAGALALFVSMPFGGLEGEGAMAFLESSPGIPTLLAAAPSLKDDLTSGRQWRVLEALEGAARELTPLERHLVGIELVVGDDFVPQDYEFADGSLYWRRVDVALEALGSEFTSDAVIEALVDVASHLAEESKSTFASLLTGQGLIDVLEIAHESQVYLTGIYVPYAGDALRWGQRQLGTFTDEALAMALAADYVRLQALIEMGDVAPVREYGEALAEDLQQLSKKRASGASDGKAVRQLRIFTVMLGLVADLLGDDADGLAPELTPSFIGMRIPEVKSLAEAMAINIRFEDGKRDPDSSDRTVLHEPNWKVADQSPRADIPLGRRREVRVWVLKQGEKLSRHQVKAIAALEQRESPGPMS